MDISIPYYEDLSRISNSNIGWFLNKGPAFLHKMLTEPPQEDKNPTLERGTMIHEYLLQPEEFQKDYVVWDKSRPSSAQQEKFCQELASSVEIEPNRAVLSAYKESYRTTGKSEDKILVEGLKIASELKDYIEYLKSKDERKMISLYDVKMLEQIKQNITSHGAADCLLKYGEHPALEDITKSVEHHHEFHINWEWGNVKCKSLLDSVSFDKELHKCTIMDLKTTAKLWHFEESIAMYDYCRQLMYYTMAAKWYIENELKERPEQWTFEYYIIGIDTTGTYEIRVFKISEDDVNARIETIQQALTDISWHQQNDKWEHSIKYYLNGGIETLNL